MLHIVVADDEEIIRHGIVEFIRTVYPDLVIDGAFSDGTEVLSYLESHQTDIILTDVRMSAKTGIDVAEYVFHKMPECRVLFLSGYQEFEYARQAMRFHVKHYLSKPVRPKELKAALDEVIREVQDEKERKEKELKAQESMENLIVLAKQKLFSDILFGGVKGYEKISESARTLALDDAFLANNRCGLVSMRILEDGGWHYSRTELYTSLFNLFREARQMESFIPVIQKNSDSVFVVTSGNVKGPEEMRERLGEDLAFLARTAKELLKTEIFFDILYVCRDVWLLGQFAGLGVGGSLNSVLLEEKHMEFATKIISQDKQGALEVLELMRQYTDGMTLFEKQRVMVDFYKTVADKLSDRIESPEDIICLQKAQDASDAAGLFDWCGESLESMLTHVSGKKGSMEMLTIKKAKDFIEKNFSQDILLTDIAEHVFLNPTYLSRFFKQRVGITPIDYLAEIRMKNAVELFKTHRYKVYEISSMCGYKSSKYFARCFKQATGMTPSEFSRRQE